MARNSISSKPLSLSSSTCTAPRERSSEAGRSPWEVGTRRLSIISANRRSSHNAAPSRGLVVPQQDPPPGLRLLPRHLTEPGDQRLGQRMLDRRVMVVTLQVLAAGGGRQAVRFDHPADEPGPGRQQVAGVIVEQHAAEENREIAVVAGAIGAAVLDPQQALHVDPLVRGAPAGSRSARSRARSVRRTPGRGAAVAAGAARRRRPAATAAAPG
ncbi:Uncharacterised protein [Pseudomonas aeruginosa]|nr:Uncharacterised protein [Pseudomonas aeruginosa]